MAICENCGSSFVTDGNRRRRSCSRACAAALAWKDPESRSRRVASITAQKRSPAARDFQRRLNAERWSRPGERQKLAEWNRQRWADPATKKMLSEAIQRAQGSPDQRAHYSRLRRRQWATDTIYRERTVAGIRRAKRTSEARRLFSALMRARWRDPIWREKYLLAAKANRTGGVPRPSRGKNNIVSVPVLQFTPDEIRVLGKARAAVMRRARGKPSTTADLAAIAATYKGPIKKFPAGAHRGWTPSWMGK